MVNKENELEKCIMPKCRKILPIRKDTPINLRKYYVRGAGQPCEDCYNEIYSNPNQNSL